MVLGNILLYGTFDGHNLLLKVNRNLHKTRKNGNPHK